MMKKLVGASNEDWKFQSIDPSGYLETGETMVGMCDLSAPCYEKCMVFQGKDTLQTEWMFKEYLLSKKHLFSMLEVLTQGEKHISLNNEVNVRVVLDQSCRLYLVEKKGLHVHVPAPLQTGLTNSTGLQCRIWAHKILMHLHAVHGNDKGASLDSIVDMYAQKYSTFLVADALAPAEPGKMVTHQSDDFQQRFDLRIKLLERSIEGEEVWWRFLKQIIQGKSPRTHLPLLQRNGKKGNYWVQLFWSKNKRFVIVVFEQDMQLPEHLDSERHRLAGAEPVNRWKLLAWAFRALKWFYRSNNTRLSLKYILEDDRLVHPIMVVVDMNKGHLKEAIVHKSVAFLELFGDLETMMHNVVRPANVSSRVMVLWESLVQPLYRGRQPVMEREIRCTDGRYRWFRVRACFGPSKRFVIGHLEIMKESPTIERQDHTPFQFGVTDFRPTIHQLVRMSERRKTLAPHWAQVDGVKKAMVEKVWKRSAAKKMVSYY